MVMSLGHGVQERSDVAVAGTVMVPDGQFVVFTGSQVYA